MPKLVVAQIKGSNGSGKSTIVTQLLSLWNEQNYYLYDDTGKVFTRSSPNKKGNIIATVNPQVGWIGVGAYDLVKPTRCGCDPFNSIALIKDAIEQAIQYGLEQDAFGVVFEGMMISTIKSTFYQWLLQKELEYDIAPMFVILKATKDGCVRRIQARGTKRKGKRYGVLNVENLASKCALVVRHGRTYDQSYVKWIDVETCEKDYMVLRFLEAVGDTEMWNEFVSSGSL